MSRYPSGYWECWNAFGGFEFGPGPVLVCVRHEIKYEEASLYPSKYRIQCLNLVVAMLKKDVHRESWKLAMGKRT